MERGGERNEEKEVKRGEEKSEKRWRRSADDWWGGEGKINQAFRF